MLNAMTQSRTLKNGGPASIANSTRTNGDVTEASSVGGDPNVAIFLQARSGALTKKQRAACDLVYRYGFTQAKAAEKLGVHVHAVEQLLSRAISRLKMLGK
jgi:DNA-directed RNA polymerase specialized sigma24 family protein